MRTLFISDIHGILDNVKRIDFKKYDEVIFLGDLYPYSYDEDICNEAEEFIKNIKNIICIKGNTDYYNENIFTFNDYIKFSYDDVKLICTHGDKYGYGKQKPLELFDVMIYGHEHVPSINVVDDHVYICVGSISKPRHQSKCSYLEYSDGLFTLMDIDGNVIDSYNAKSKEN